MKRLFLLVMLACLVLPEIDSQSTNKFIPLSFEEADQQADSHCRQIEAGTRHAGA